MDADRIIAEAAEQHRITYSHSVVVQPGNGWACEVCDPDIFPDFGTVYQARKGRPGSELILTHSPGEWGTVLSARYWEAQAAIWALFVMEWALSTSGYPGRVTAMQEAYDAMHRCREWAAADRRMAEWWSA